MKSIVLAKLGPLLIVSAAFANPILSVQPAQLIEPSTTPFSINVVIQGVDDLYGFQFDLTFASNILAANRTSEGPFLSAAGESTFFVPGRIGTGTISAISATLLGPVPGVSGDGTLATVNFINPVGLATGISTVTLSNVLLLDSSSHSITVTTVPAVVTVTPEPENLLVMGGGLLSTFLIRCRKWRFAILPAVLLLPALTKPAAALSPGYKFTIVVKSGDMIGRTIVDFATQYIAMNDAGTIVFLCDIGGVGRAVCTPSQVLASVGDTISGKTLASLDQVPAINNAGTVVFHAVLSGGSQALFTPDRLLIETGDVISGVTLPNLLGGAKINNAGLIAFVAYGGLYGPAYLFTAAELLATSGDTIAGNTLTNICCFSMNDAGMIVFGANFNDPQGNASYGAFSLDQLLVADGQEIGGVTIPDARGSPWINNSGSFVTSTGTFGIAPRQLEAILTPSEALVRTGEMIGGTTLLAVGGHDTFSMNNAGTLAFLGNLAGIFTTWETVALAGDMIDGKTLNYLGPPVINSVGTIAFEAGFTDGTLAIVTASPIASGVPGDVNGDGIVDCTDLEILKPALERKLGQAGYNPRADVNGDGVVDLRDLVFVAQRLAAGSSCP